MTTDIPMTSGTPGWQCEGHLAAAKERPEA
jgi:hypothetical protein